MTAARTLLSLLADGHFHSGEALGRALGVSRAAVWKALQDLPRYGITVDAVHGRGYRLRSAIELLDKNAIESAMAPPLRGCLALEVLFEVDSTNRRLLSQVGTTAHGAVCLAEMQTAGRGRRGRVWVSPFGSNLYCSLLWRFNEGPARLAGLSLAVGVATVRALARVGAVGVQVKWPNDLLWNGRKLAGILLEVVGESNGPCHVVVGLGINVGMPADAEIDQPWADLRQLVPEVSRNQLAGMVLEELLRVMQSFETDGFDAVREEWMGYDAFAGRRVTLYLPNSRVVGIARGVDQSGHLLVEHEDGLVQRFASGEVSLRGD